MRIRDQVGWKSVLFPAVPLILWLAICSYFWSVDALDRFQVLVALVMLAAFAYYCVSITFWRVAVSEHGIVLRGRRKRSVGWQEIIGFEVEGRSLCIVLKDGSHVPMPAPTPGNARYEENLRYLNDRKAAHARR